MRFKEFLAERTFTDLNRVLEKVKSNCGTFLKSSGGQLVFRGVPGLAATSTGTRHHDSKSAHYMAHPADRLPKDSGRTPYFNFMFNAGCEVAFGIEEIRKKSLFASGDHNMAGIYGEVNLFFPVGDFEFLGSTSIDDSYEHAEKFRYNILENLEASGFNISDGQLKKGLGDIVSHMSTREWVDNKGGDARELTNEVFEKVLGYSPNLGSFYATLRDALNDTFTLYYKDGGDLRQFVAKGFEILFYETHGFYLIPLKMFREALESAEIEHHNFDIISTEMLNHISSLVYEDKV